MIFDQLAPEYEKLAASAQIIPGREHQIETACDRLLRNKELYSVVSEKTAVPVAALMALSEREMAGDTSCYLGNGQRLTMRTTIVPIGRGPFPDTSDGFIAGCLDALHLDGLDQVASQPGGWSLARFCYESESWNGWGYRARGIPSPYVFGATTVQRPGKFIRDHVYSATTMDPQIGTLAIVEELVKLDTSLKFFDAVTKIEDATIVPAPHPVISVVPIDRVQTMLNQLKVPGTPLLVDGNCARGTRAAVWEYQRTHHLVTDGLPGPMTYASLLQSVAEIGL